MLYEVYEPLRKEYGGGIPTTSIWSDHDSVVLHSSIGFAMMVAWNLILRIYQSECSSFPFDIYYSETWTLRPIESRSKWGMCACLCSINLLR